MPPIRGNYTKISQIDRQRLITAFEQDSDWIALAEQLGIMRQSARSIIIKFRRTGRVIANQKGGKTYEKINEKLGRCILEEVEMKPTITLKEIRQMAVRDFPTNRHVCVQSISNFLDKQLITVRNLTSTPVQWNQPSVKVERQEFFQWLMHDCLQKTLVFQDETGFNLWTARTRGRAARDRPAVRVVEGQRGRNSTVCFAMC